MSSIAKYGYCGWVLKMDNIHHSCFSVYDDTCHVLSIDEAGKVVMLNKTIQKNMMETSSTACGDLTEDGNNASKAQEMDEELIS